ncbi:MAG: hypothetical protein G01um101466_588 [Parcubacteria group bacterium Gr01-1014_66]|nr:MAG: hypothetical protein G01um101466_588 [Parcubacteria group bacterium Gr01-1014_66]
MTDPDCRNRKRHDLTNQEWVKYQLDCNLDREIRDVLLHASFIEGVIIAESEKYHTFPYQDEKGKFRSFWKALNLLKGKMNDEFNPINEMRELRNELIHGIAKNGFDQKTIERKRDSLYCLILKVYNGNFMNNKFKERFDVSTQKLTQVNDLSLLNCDDIKRNSFDT